MMQKYYTNQVTLLQGNIGVTFYGEAARVIEIIAVSAALIITVTKIAKALQWFSNKQSPAMNNSRALSKSKK